MKAGRRTGISDGKVMKMLGPDRDHAFARALNKDFNIDKKTHQTSVKIAILSKGQLIGQEDVMNSRHYTTTVKCISDKAVLYGIKAEEFNFRLGRDEKAWRALADMSV